MSVHICNELLLLIGEFVDAKTLAKLSMLSKECKQLFVGLPQGNYLWKALCDDKKMRPLVPPTRTRGIIPYKRVYEDNLCWECSDDGSNGRVLINCGSGSLKATELVSLCKSCFNSVMGLSWTDRKKYSLPRLKATLGFPWLGLLEKIPKADNRSTATKTNQAVDSEGAFQNDFLVNRMKKKKR